MKFDNRLRQQVFSLPEMIQQQFDDLEPKVRTVLSTPDIYSIQRIIITGCGDPYAAGLSVQTAFKQLTHVPTEVVPIIELSRYYPSNQIGTSPINPLIIVVSNFGEVARVCEAAERMKQLGGFVLGITERPNSSFTKFADRTLNIELPAFPSAPGTRSYVADVMALLLLAIRIGEVRGNYTMDTAALYRNDLRGQGQRLAELLPSMDSSALRIAEQWCNIPAFDFIGSDLDYGAAWYSCAKVFEAIGKFAMHNNTEDWLHTNFFIRDVKNIASIIFTSKHSPAFSRTSELINYNQLLTRPFLVVSSGESELFQCSADNFIAVPDADFEFNRIITQFSPVNLILGYIQKMIGEEDGRGCTGLWDFCNNGKSVNDSKIVIMR